MAFAKTRRVEKKEEYKDACRSVSKIVIEGKVKRRERDGRKDG